jgi:hypothetical protein
MENSNIGKNVYWADSNLGYHVKYCGTGIITDKIFQEGTDYYLVKDDKNNVETIPCYWVRTIYNT